MKKKHIPIECFLLLLVAGLLAWGTSLEKQQQRISGNILRLHVVAASDEEADQEVKLKVRDAVLRSAEPLLQDAGSSGDAKALLSGHLSDLEQAANHTLLENGSPMRATVTLDRELFGTRYYEDFTLPGGYYDALRVTIGPGEGKNWWCVVYPQICTAATAEGRQAAAVMGGLSQEDTVLISEEDTTFRFRSLELLENILGWFRSGKKGIPTSG